MTEKLLTGTLSLNTTNQHNTYEPPHDKTNKMTCAPSEDKDQPGHLPILIRAFAVRLWVAKDPNVLQVDSEDSDQTGRMPRLIRVFAGRTCHFVGFVMQWRAHMHSLSIDVCDRAWLESQYIGFIFGIYITNEKRYHVWNIFVHYCILNLRSFNKQEIGSSTGDAL